MQGAPVVVPRAAGDATKAFAELAEKFNLDPKITTHLVNKEKLVSLEEFSFIATKEEDLDTIIQSVADLENPLLQTARLRMAWVGIKNATRSAESSRRRDAEAEDLHKLLPQPELDNLHDIFWVRHRLTFDPDEEPADALVSRLSREITRRLLTVRDVWATKTLSHQLRSERKRSRLTEEIDLVQTEREVDTPVKHTLTNFLRLHMVLMVAYAKAGVKKREGAPESEVRGSDTTLFVEVPFDVLLRYHRRVAARAYRLAELGQNALDWVQQRDESERSLWVKETRNGKHSIGLVIKSLFDQREAIWMIDEDAIRERKQRDQHRQVDQSRRRDAVSLRPKGDGKAGAKGKGKRERIETADKMKDGSPLCSSWNRGSCQEPCPAGSKHQCSRLLKGEGGRVCGSRAHTARECNNPRRVM